MADFTYVPLAGGGYGYTAFVIDAFAGSIPGWECSLFKHTRFVESAIRQATALRARQGHRLRSGTGVFQPSVLRGRLLSAIATASRSSRA